MQTQNQLISTKNQHPEPYFQVLYLDDKLNYRVSSVKYLLIEQNNIY